LTDRNWNNGDNQKGQVTEQALVAAVPHPHLESSRDVTLPVLALNVTELPVDGW
jgi:hypothetical protein